MKINLLNLLRRFAILVALNTFLSLVLLHSEIFYFVIVIKIEDEIILVILFFLLVPFIYIVLYIYLLFLIFSWFLLFLLFLFLFLNMLLLRLLLL